MLAGVALPDTKVADMAKGEDQAQHGNMHCKMDVLTAKVFTKCTNVHKCIRQGLS